MSNYFPTGVRSPIMRIRGMSGLGAVDWSTCASTRPDPDDPTHFVDCLDANGAVIDSKPTPATSAAASATIFGYDSTLVIGIGAAVALLLLLKGKKGRR